MRKTSQAATKLRGGAPVSSGKLGVSRMRASELAGPSRAKRHETSFTRKKIRSRNTRSCLTTAAPKFPHLPWRGGRRAKRGGGGGSVDGRSCGRQRRAPRPARLRRSTLPLQGRVKRAVAWIERSEIRER